MPRLLSYLLGDKVNLVAIRKDQAVGIREEYHTFRNKAVWVMGTVPMLLYLGMKRADHVTGGDKDSITLTPALLTGARQAAGAAAAAAARQQQQRQRCIGCGQHAAQQHGKAWGGSRQHWIGWQQQ